MKIALLGGTSFGTALAVRLRDAGYDVVIGSRDADRAGAAAAVLGVEGTANEGAARAADLVVIATKADGAVETARALREAIGTTPVLSVAAELSFSKDGVAPTVEATSIAQRIQDVVDGPVIAGLHSLAASNLGGEGRPTRTRWSAATTWTRRSSCSSSPASSPRGGRSTRDRSRAPARWRG